MSNPTPTVRRRRLGLILRGMREQRGLTGEQVVAEVERSGSWLARVEAGRVGVRRGDLTALLDVYQVTEARLRADLLALARSSAEPGWWARHTGGHHDSSAAYLDFEAEADSLRVYQALAVHGLLQTEEYARATIRAALPTARLEAAERTLRTRMARQRLLTRPDPLRVWAVLDEALLHRRVGGGPVLRDQLNQLLRAAELPSVTIQVLPFVAGAHPGLLGSFSLIQFPAPDEEDVAYVEGGTGDLFAEGADARWYGMVFEHLQASALSPTRSYELIERTVRRLS